MPKIKVTFNENKPIINGKKSTPHHNGNNGRHVYISGKYVLKLDDRGYVHNDLAVWKQIKRQDRKYFVPTLAQGRTDDGVWWSIQPYVELDKDFTSEAKEIVERLVDKYGLFDIDIYDDDQRNWAMHNGQPIIFDYGMT